ncbi:MAG: hypothetical protein IPJ66_14945 [Bacteroidetes bacterium]|nr:hypothetical protein [Bacteroidota bacterium]
MPTMRPAYSSMVTTPILPQKGYTVKAILIKQIPFKMPIVQCLLISSMVPEFMELIFPYNKQGYYKRRNGEPLYYDKSVFPPVHATIQIEYQVKNGSFTIGIDVVPYYEFYNPGPEWIDFACHRSLCVPLIFPE